MPRKEGTGARFVPAGGEKCYGFAANRFTFPERTGEECRQNGRRAESAIPPLGESATVSRQIDSHLPPKEDKCTPVGSV